MDDLRGPLSPRMFENRTPEGEGGRVIQNPKFLIGSVGTVSITPEGFCHTLV